MSLSGYLIIESVELFSQGAINIEPPVTDKVLLVEQGSVGTEEAVLGQTALAVVGADVEGLAVGLHVGVVPAVHLTVAQERGLGHLGKDRIVVPGHAGDGILQ